MAGLGDAGILSNYFRPTDAELIKGHSRCSGACGQEGLMMSDKDFQALYFLKQNLDSKG